VAKRPTIFVGIAAFLLGIGVGWARNDLQPRL
jgi:hypothetical protein